MKQTIDHTFKNVSDNEEGKTLFGFTINTVSKYINQIEKQYFDGRKIYHGLTNSQNNPILFRHEIKGLLLLLLKLELEDPFHDEKSKITGVSETNIEKILDTYTYALDILSSHEYQVLMQYMDIENGMTFIDCVKSFKDELKRVLVLIATKYHDHAINYYDQFIRKIRDISVSIIYSTKELRFFNSNHNLRSLDLREPIMRAINCISNDIYYFDKNKICKRNVMLPDKYVIYQYKSKNEESNIREKYYEIRQKHLSYERTGLIKDGNASYDIKLDEQTELDEDHFKTVRDDNDNIDTVREKLDDVLEQLYKQAYPIKRITNISLPSKENVDYVLEKIKKELREYIPLFCKMQNLCYDKLSAAERKEIFLNDRFLLSFQNKRYPILHTDLCDYPFAGYLVDIEQYLSDRLLEDKVPSEEEIDTIVDKCIQDYKVKVGERAKWVREEFQHLDDNDFLKKEYSGIIDNINDIDLHCDALAKNLIAMILKQESDRGLIKSVRMCEKNIKKEIILAADKTDYLEKTTRPGRASHE